MSDDKLVGSTHGFDLYEATDGTGFTIRRGGHVVGFAFPARLADPGGTWFGRRQGEFAVRFDLAPFAVAGSAEHQAIVHVVGDCPECRCDPVACETDDSGDSCRDCAVCMNGCPYGTCNVLKEGVA